MFTISSNVVDIAALVVLEAVLFICCLVVYVMLVSQILPRIFLKPKYDLPVISDRGIKKYVFKEGRAIVYEPSILTGRYIQQYILSSHKGEKFLKCKIDPRVYSIKFDVVAMDADDKVIDIIRVAEPIRQLGVTTGAAMPRNTSYVSVIVKEVNNTKAEPRTTLKISKRSALLYMLWTVICSVLIGALIMLMMTLWTDMAFYKGYEYPGIGAYLSVLPACAVLGLIISGITILLNCSKEIKIKK